VHISVVADDLDAVFVCTHGAIGAQAPEFAGNGAFRYGEDLFIEGQRKLADVIVDTHAKAMETALLQVFVYGQYHGGGKFFAGEAIASTDHLDVLALQGRDHVQIERLADGSGFFGAVQHSDAFHALGQSGEEMLFTEGTIHSYLDQA